MLLSAASFTDFNKLGYQKSLFLFTCYLISLINSSV